jgi:tRNA-dependent cyclodipeptide synthase
MVCEIGVVRGSTEEIVKARNFNIYLGISLGNKWFTKEHIKEYMLWALEYSRGRVGVVVADSLQAINYQYRDNYSREAALKRALRYGDGFVSMIEEIISELPEKDGERIDVIRWADVKKDPNYNKTLTVFVSEFQQNKKFKNALVEIVRDFTKRLDREISEERAEKLCYYLLDELPELTNGFNIKGTYYNCFLYPEDALLLQFIEKLQKKEIFPEFHEKTSIKNNVFVQLEVLEQN